MVIYDVVSIECGECGSPHYETFSRWDGTHGIRCLDCKHESGMDMWNNQSSADFSSVFTSTSSTKPRTF